MAMKVFTGNANRDLAAAICKHFGDPALGTALVDRFPDGETRVRIQDNVRGADVFVIQVGNLFLSFYLHNNSYLDSKIFNSFVSFLFCFHSANMSSS
jgi:phosphoribosylpyrophosphate synthetase